MTSVALHLKCHHRKTLQNILKSAPTLPFSHLFFSSSSSDDNGGNSSKPPNFSSIFSDIKSRLKHQEQEQQQTQQHPSMGRRTFQFTQQGSSNPPKVPALDEIRKNLAEFRWKSSPELPSSPPNSKQPTLLQDLYNKNMGVSNPNTQKGNPSFEAIRESLRQLRGTQAEKGKTGNDHLSLNKYKDNFKLGPSIGDGGSRTKEVFGGTTGELPTSVFGRELNEREMKKSKKKKGEDDKESDELDFRKYELIKMYTHAELGEKLKDLRPEAKGKREKESGFSLEELNERLRKLREMEEKQPVRKRSGLSFGDLRTGLQQIKFSKEENANKVDYQRADIVGQLDRSQAFRLNPPKEDLVEKYFHPDNMSSEEKLKLELKRVRDEFKMHESDCGSARAQIAQLTTEISHLSSVLHKKDKHSRKGLIAKVQRRKKLLKYLRRTDWDSYCFVLSKLGLRDNPDYKH